MIARRLLGLAAAALCALDAAAAITCSVSVTPVTVVYDPTSPVQNVTTGSYTVTCNRLASDPNTLDWRLGVNNGLQAGGGYNRVRRSGGPANQRYNYDTYRSPGNLWGDTNATRFTGTLVFGGSLTASVSGAFDIVLPGSQPVDPAGTYTDTLTATLRRNGFPWTTYDTATFGGDHHQQLPDLRAAGGRQLQLHRVPGRAGARQRELRRALHHRAALFHGARRDLGHAARAELFAFALGAFQHRHRRDPDACHQRHHRRRAGGNLRHRCLQREPDAHANDKLVARRGDCESAASRRPREGGDPSL
jgi:spore coat protein U-like protein